MVFPGQGSQSLGMLSALAASYPVVKSIYVEASKVLEFNLWELIQDGPEDELNKTENTQPALLAAGVAVWRVWNESKGRRPVLLAGHSLGETTALVCAGVLAFKDAVALVADRGKYMQEAVPAGTGAMAAILGLEDKQVTEVCEQITDNQVVSTANFNSPGQVVIAGHRAAVEDAVELAKKKGAKRALLLPISVPSHCSLMQDAADKYTQRLESVQFSDANMPVIQNVDANEHSSSQEIKQALIQQMHQPVRWVETILTMKSNGITRIIECGPGRVLTGLIKRIDRSLDALCVHDPESLQVAIKTEI